MLNSLTKLLQKSRDDASDGELIFHPSRTCPECSTKLARHAKTCSGADWHCPNLDCPAKVRERLEHWCSAEALDIPLADRSLVAQLVERGLALDVAELYSLKPAEAAALEERDQEFGKAFLAQLASSKSKAGWRVLYGLGVPHVDAEIARQLCRHFGAVDDILASGPERLIKQAGVSLTIAKSIAFWFGDSVNRRLVRRLQKAGLNFKTGA